MPAVVAGTHDFESQSFKDVDGRNKSGHDGPAIREWAEKRHPRPAVPGRRSGCRKSSRKSPRQNRRLDPRKRHEIVERKPDRFMLAKIVTLVRRGPHRPPPRRLGDLDPLTDKIRYLIRRALE